MQSNRAMPSPLTIEDVMDQPAAAHLPLEVNKILEGNALGVGQGVQDLRGNRVVLDLGEAVDLEAPELAVLVVAVGRQPVVFPPDGVRLLFTG